jgi:hypothetical protein
MTIDCDNLQTINFVTKNAMKLQTKLRHVDSHNHWLRQEVSNGILRVRYILSADMPADGLTKVLPANKWNAFLQQLDLMPNSRPQSTTIELLFEEMQDCIEAA